MLRVRVVYNWGTIKVNKDELDDLELEEPDDELLHEEWEERVNELEEQISELEDTLRI